MMQHSKVIRDLTLALRLSTGLLCDRILALFGQKSILIFFVCENRFLRRKWTGFRARLSVAIHRCTIVGIRKRRNAGGMVWVMAVAR